MRCYFYLAILFIGTAWGASSGAPSLSFAQYDSVSGQLQMNLVTPSAQGDVLLRSGDKMQSLPGGRLTGLFTLVVPVTCSRLAAGATLYWATAGHPLVAAPIPPQRCDREPSPIPSSSPLPAVKIYDKQGVCWLDVGNSTLWRAALALGELNKATVYQNIYGLFLSNRAAFVAEDINRLTAKALRCPSTQLINDIPATDAKRLFQEMLMFQQQGKR